MQIKVDNWIKLVFIITGLTELTFDKLFPGIFAKMKITQLSMFTEKYIKGRFFSRAGIHKRTGFKLNLILLYRTFKPKTFVNMVPVLYQNRFRQHLSQKLIHQRFEFHFIQNLRKKQPNFLCKHQFHLELQPDLELNPFCEYDPWIGVALKQIGMFVLKMRLTQLSPCPCVSSVCLSQTPGLSSCGTSWSSPLQRQDCRPEIARERQSMYLLLAQ